MNIVESKKQLKEKGYCSFNLEQLNPKIYKILRKQLMCNKEENFKEAFKNLRADIKYEKITTNINKNYTSHIKAKTIKNELLEKSKIENSKLSQMWYFANINDVTNLLYPDETYSDFLRKFLRDTYDEIIRYFFDFPEEQKFEYNMEFTYYDKNCHIENHTDGLETGRVCACLIYLNEKYSFDNGGYLVLENTEKILPKIGNVAIMDLQSFDIPHMVTEVTGGIGRYALLSFVKKKEDEFIDSKYNKKNKLI